MIQRKIVSAVPEFVYGDRHDKSIRFRWDGAKTRTEEERPLHPTSLCTLMAAGCNTFRETRGVTPFTAIGIRISC
jgi:hypothetical protein